jgi:hypothetical protein
MNGANNLEESDVSPLQLCPGCLHNKLYSAVARTKTQWNVLDRYLQLSGFMFRMGFETEAAWYTAALERCQQVLGGESKIEGDHLSVGDLAGKSNYGFENECFC